MHNIKKRIAAFALIAGLSLSHTVTVLAADPVPENYVFSMVLRACGVSPGEKVGAWQNAYEGYLEKTQNQPLLNQINDPAASCGVFQTQPLHIVKKAILSSFL